MTRGYDARLLTPDEHGAWDELVATAPEGSPYHDSTYLDALCRAAGGDFRILAVHDGQELVGGVPLYERSSVTGAFVRPRLLLYYNGLVLRDYDTRYPSRVTSRHLGMMEALEGGLDARGYAGVELRCRSPRVDVRPFLEGGWSVRPGYTYVVQVDDTETLWERIDNNLRRLVRRADEEGLRFTEDDDFESFHRLHRTVAEEKGAPLYLDRVRFERFFRDLHESGMLRICHARLPGGESVAAALVLASSHPVTHTVSAAADPEHYDTGASPFLRWRVFQALGEAGYRANDLTDASLDSVSRFKRQLGADLELNLVLRRQNRVHGLERSLSQCYWRVRDGLGAVLRSITASSEPAARASLRRLRPSSA